MKYTITAARYANPDLTAAVIATEEAGDVLISEVDTPEEWAAAHDGAISIAPFVAPPKVIAPVTRRQIKLALLEMGILDQALSWISGASRATQIEWEDATTLRRDHPMWSAAAEALGKTEEDIDNLFTIAATL